VDYVGCLLFKDDASCERLAGILERCCGMLIEAIGSLEISDRIVAAPTSENERSGHTSIWPRTSYIVLPSLTAKL
jgi:hypothetical protein